MKVWESNSYRNEFIIKDSQHSYLKGRYFKTNKRVRKLCEANKITNLLGRVCNYRMFPISHL